MDIMTWLLIIGLGAVCGLVGQLLRVLVGLHKASQENPKPEFEPKRLFVSLLIGLLAGVLAALAGVTATTVSLEQIGALISAGYAGADFVEGFVGRFLTK